MGREQLHSCLFGPRIAPDVYIIASRCMILQEEKVGNAREGGDVLEMDPTRTNVEAHPALRGILGKPHDCLDDTSMHPGGRIDARDRHPAPLTLLREKVAGGDCSGHDC